MVKIQSSAAPNYYVRGLEKYLLIRQRTDFINEVNLLFAFRKSSLSLWKLSRARTDRLCLFFPLFSAFSSAPNVSISEEIVDVETMVKQRKMQ
jgi:hypothetical protein